MLTFNDVSVIKKANLYFDGQVSSRTVNFNDGSRKTLGLMQVGDYTFATAEKELMEILGGECEVKLAGTSEWKNYKEGDLFEVDANSSFDVKAITPTDYCCSYFS